MCTFPCGEMTESVQERYDKVGAKISKIGHLLQIVLWLQEVSITPRFLIYWVSKTHLLQLQEVQEEQHHYDELDKHYFKYCQWTDTLTNIHCPLLQQRQWSCQSQELLGLRKNHVFEDLQQFCSEK